MLENRKNIKEETNIFLNEIKEEKEEKEPKEEEQ